MADFLSPGVVVSEIDLTTVIPAVATSIGAHAGHFNWGPIDEIVTISNETQLVDRFGYPDAANSSSYISFFSAANFLSYSNNLKVIRSLGVGAKNATSNSSINALIKNEIDYISNYSSGSSSINTGGPFVAKYAGAVGNSLKYSILDANTACTTVFSSWAYANNFPSAPGTSPFAANKGGSNDEIHLVVVDEDGLFTGIPGNILEKYSYLSRASDAQNSDGSSNYYKEVINRQSKYLRWVGQPLFTQLNGRNGPNLVVTGNIITALTITGGANYSNGYVTFSGGGPVSTNSFIGVANTANISYTLANVANVNVFTVSVISGGFYSNTHNLTFSTNTSGVGAVITPTFSQVTLPYTNSTYSGGSSSSTFTPSSSNLTVSLVNGSDGAPGTANLQTSYALLNNSDEIDVGLIFTGQYDSTVLGTLKTLAETRKDCMVFFSPAQTSVVNNYGSETGSIITNRAAVGTSSYLFMDSGFKYQYDKYNDQYVWIPCNADVAGIVAKTDNDRDPWFSPGGLNRGFIRNIVKLAYNPNKADRDILYNRQINPIVTFSGEGTVLFGDKTLTDKPSAFDRINVRRLFIVLEKAISRAAKYSLFEFNDAFTRAQFVSLVEPYLRDIQGRRGITDYRVVCDETNNTAEVIDRNQFVGDIYIKPTRSINYIQLNFVAVRTGVSFDEIVGRF